MTAVVRLEDGAKLGEWHAVGLDVTGHYRIAEEDRPHIRRIIDTFIYDRSTVTHLCELTPSYDLHFLHTEIEWEGFPPDEIRERLDERYAHEPTEDCYMHCSDIDRVKEMHVPFGRPASEDEARDYWQGNCPF